MSDTTSRELTIAGLTFNVSTPFVEGHTCSAAEAKSLNQTRAENIRNNQATAVKAAKNEDGSISDEAMAELKKSVTAYDKGYEFTLASVGGGRSALSPVEKEARKIAREQITEALKAQNRKVGDIEKDKLLAAVIKRSEGDDIIKLAKKRIAEKSKIAETALEGLDLGDDA